MNPFEFYSYNDALSRIGLGSNARDNFPGVVNGCVNRKKKKEKKKTSNKSKRINRK